MNAINTNNTAAAANTNTGLTITVKPYGVTVQVGQDGYLTEATICKFNDSRHFAASLLTGGVKLAAKPHLITTLQNANMDVAYFFHQLDVLMSQGLTTILLGDGVAPHIPDGLWEKKARRELDNAKRREMAAKRREVKWVRKTAEQEIESDFEEVEEVETKPMPVVESVKYEEAHINRCQRRLTAAVRNKDKDDLARLLSYIAFIVAVPASFAKVVSTAIILEKVTPQTLDAMKDLRRLNPKFRGILAETLVVFQQDLTAENIGEDEAELVNALNVFAKEQGYDNKEMAVLLHNLIAVLNAIY